MELARVAFKYLKRYPLLSSCLLIFVMLESLFESASLGMMIPFLQSVMGPGAAVFDRIPILKHFHMPFPSSDRFHSISVVLILLFLIIILKNIFVYISSILTAKLRFVMSRDLSVELMDCIIDYDFKFFDTARSGYIMSHLSNETRRMGDFISLVGRLTAVLARVAAFIALLCMISVKVSAIIFFLAAAVLFPLELIMKRIKGLGGAVSSALSDYTHKLTEILNGIRMIKGSATERFEKMEFRKTADALYVTQFDTNRYIHLLIPISEASICGLIVLGILIMVNIVKIDVVESFPFIATYLLVLVRTLTQMNMLNNLRSSSISNLAAFRNYEEISDTKGKMTILGGEGRVERFKNSIEFRDVSFYYDKSKKILEGVNIRIPKGRITAIVGPSGAGKSTIVNLIPRFYDVDTVEVLVDGINIKQLELGAWRRKIGFVSQDTFIFNAPVKYNIAYGRFDAGEGDIIKAAEAANIHGFVMSMPDKYNTILGERGVRLSGGQRQRISIARAVLNDPEILILDEATSSLDTETERLITEAVNRLTKNRTVVAIAHRLSTILHADNIIVIDEGRIVESGRHDELIKADGLYKRLYEIQFNIRNSEEAHQA